MARTLPKQIQQKICWEINFQTAFELFLLVRTIIKGIREAWTTPKNSLNQIRQKFPQRKNLLMPWWKPLPMTGEVYGRWCGKTATRPTTVQGARKERFYFEQRNSGSTICTLPLRRSSCLKAAQRFRVVEISSRGCFSLHFTKKIKRIRTWRSRNSQKSAWAMLLISISSRNGLRHS